MQDEGILEATDLEFERSVAPREISQAEYDVWLDSRFFLNAYINAAEALREEASRAFVRGADEIAFLLRERANVLEEQGQRDSDEWQKVHAPK